MAEMSMIGAVTNASSALRHFRIGAKMGTGARSGNRGEDNFRRSSLVEDPFTAQRWGTSNISLILLDSIPKYRV